MSRKTHKGGRAALPLLLLLAACADEGFGSRKPVLATLPPPAPALTPEPPLPATSATGSLFHPSRYTGLAQDRRASRVGDLITIRLVERTQASKASSAGSTRTSDNQITLPDAPPFSFVPPGLLQGGASQNFTGNGTAAQNNQLFGELTVTVAEVLPGGVLRVSGEKRLLLNRGEEQIQLTGLVRILDLAADNSLPSTRVADAHITYAGTGQIADQSRQGWLARFFAKVNPL